MKPEDLRWRVVDKPGETFKVHRSIYTDPEIFEAELKHIYEGNWIYVAHESEIPNPGDYITTVMGRQPVIITRSSDGQIRGFINACSHRGANVCRKPHGNAKHWTCPYHGWVFDNQGTLLDVKNEAGGGYLPSFDKANYGLTPVPQVGSYRGFIFASLNADVLPLKEHLAGAAVFLDMFADQSEQGLEILPGFSVYTHHGNWKMQAENGVDGYHLDPVHTSYFRLAALRAKKAAEAAGKDQVKAIDVLNPQAHSGNYDLGNGHVVIWFDVANYRDRAAGMQYDNLVARFGEQRARWMAARLRQVLIYPNVILFDGISTQVRTWRPLSQDETEVTVKCIAMKGESAEQRRRRLRQYEDFYSASGLATPDDLTEFDACQSGYYGRNAEWQDFDRGMARRIIGPDEFAREVGIPARESAPDAADETLYHGEYRHWLNTLCKGLERDAQQTRREVA
ncbi:aromatic ring-hydroxylating dioxygenase subunit alpha [Immundisolibacter sp.]|uniref:aromatic ring-hydroxylating oxygenase subunit alpha n=1 Tax=Immundisolibacter sp. TaxID=1934948 RepID=UPI00262EA2AA|nr:aromatic ring-hydroxylating dioxygenase subunit alpha [Immundisolibacter sp.]MDD3649905.1 aromatic ring-hydroxylating dioxygenase subunit alpha [Immundisolibacter sp.]